MRYLRTRNIRTRATRGAAAWTVGMALLAVSPEVQAQVDPDFDNNLCSDVEQQFDALIPEAERLGINKGNASFVIGGPITGKQPHYQGMARYRHPDSGINYLYVTAHDVFPKISTPNGKDYKPGVLAVAKMGSRRRDGERLRCNSLSTTADEKNTTPFSSDEIVTNFSFGKASFGQGINFHANHPGGISILGGVLAVPVYNGGDTGMGCKVVLLDLKGNPEIPKLLAGQHEINIPSEKAGAVGLFRFASGNYGCAVLQIPETRIFIYESSTTDLRDPSNTWSKMTEYLTAQTSWPTEAGQGGSLKGQFNNISFVEDSTGLFMIGTMNVWADGHGEDFAWLYKVVTNAALNVFALAYKKKSEMELRPAGPRGDCGNFAAGGYAHVTDRGVLLLYGCEYWNGGPSDSIPVAEIYPSYFNGAETAWVRLFEHKDFQGDSITLDAYDWKGEDWGNLDNVEGFGAKTASSLMFYAQPGTKLNVGKGDGCVKTWDGTGSVFKRSDLSGDSWTNCAGGMGDLIKRVDFTGAGRSADYLVDYHDGLGGSLANAITFAKEDVGKGATASEITVESSKSVSVGGSLTKRMILTVRGSGKITLNK